MKTTIETEHKPLLIVSNGFPPSVGGLEEAVYNLSKHLHALGIRHEVVTMIDVNRFKAGPPVYRGVPVNRILYRVPRLNVKGVIHRVVAFIILLLFPLLSIYSFLRLYMLCRSLKPVLINLHFPLESAYYVLPLVKLLKIPLVVNIHGMEIDGYEDHGIFRRFPVKHALSTADMVLSNSYQLLKKACNIVPFIQEHSFVVGNGIDLNFFKENIIKGTLEEPVFKSKYILALGRFVHKKGFDILIEAFSKLNPFEIDAKLIIAGDGSLRGEYEKKVKELCLKERVVIWRRAEKDEVPVLMAGAEILVIPSREEPFGIVVLEGLASRVPIIAARTGGIPEIVEDGFTALLFNKESSEELSHLIKKLYNDEGLKTALVEAGYKLVTEKFGWDSVVRRFLEKFEVVSRC